MEWIGEVFFFFFLPLLISNFLLLGRMTSDENLDQRTFSRLTSVFLFISRFLASPTKTHTKKRTEPGGGKWYLYVSTTSAESGTHPIPHSESAEFPSSPCLGALATFGVAATLPLFSFSSLASFFFFHRTNNVFPPYGLTNRGIDLARRHGAL